MDTQGRHLLAEYWGCRLDVLIDINAIERLLRHAAEAAACTVVQAVFHQFSPTGISGVVVIEESHLSIHTWPEHGYAAVDFYTCGNGAPENAHQVLLAGLQPAEHEVMLLQRGCSPRGTPMQVVERRHTSAPHADCSADALLAGVSLPLVSPAR
jgi:S-adenosylmethionine decarboxylase proenzyme